MANRLKHETDQSIRHGKENFDSIKEKPEEFFKNFKYYIKDEWKKEMEKQKEKK